MKEFPKLFARTVTGAIQEWQVFVDKNSHFVVSGQQGGRVTRSVPVVCYGKNLGRSNETSPEEQALLEAEAKYKKQLKSGGYFESVSDIDQDRFFQPMLAKNYEDYADKIDWSKGVGVQIKYNGGRIIATKDGLFSRKGERYISIPHIEEGLRPFFRQYSNAVLDGEGFRYELREKLNEIMKLLRKTVHITNDDLKRSEELIRYYVYDGGNIGPIGFNDCYTVRKQMIDQAFRPFDGVVHEVPTHVVYSKRELDKLYQSFLEENHEGAIIRLFGQPYEQKRSKFLLKYKPVEDDEGTIVDIIEGEGNWSGTGKVIRLKWKGKEFNATFKGTFEQCKDFWSNRQKWIGKEITFEFNGLTGLGIPNYARMDIDNCLKR